MESQKVKEFYFIPEVKYRRLTGGTLEVSDDMPIERIVDPSINVDVDPDYPRIDVSHERYVIRITPSGVTLTGASKVGLYRAETTLAQLRKDHPRELPCMEIRDGPDFPVRGFYHDVTRGRVPTLDTLKRLADTLAFYKINHLQLYVEHTFAFKSVPELWEGKDPLTANDILELDKYCKDRYIDLVPSLSTFGHLYELLRLPKYEHLNELDIKASETKRCLWDRMAHYTLNVNDPESFSLVKEMIEEYAPLFSSDHFNICCDETFDLGKGKNAKTAGEDGAGVGRMYVSFVRRIMDVVRSLGKKPMLWGDIILKHPELIRELDGEDVTFLNWEYTPEVTYEPVKTFKDAGVKQYVCPGVNGWSRFAADVDRACTNISKMVKFGYDAGAAGVLNTDWGDCGQVNLLASSYHGLALGADLSWNIDGGRDFDRRFSFTQWGIRDDGRLGKILRELGALSAYHFGNLYAWVNDKQCLWYKEDDVKVADPKELRGKMIRASEIAKELEVMAGMIVDKPESGIYEDAEISGAYADSRLGFQEYVWSAAATEWLLSVLLVKKKYEYGQDIGDIDIDPRDVVNNGRDLSDTFKTLWRARNRESELRDVTETFDGVIERINTYAIS